MRLKVNTMYKGLVAIRDKYVIKSKLLKEDIVIYSLNRLKMTIKAEDVKKRLVFTSEKLVKDKFSDQLHHLCYFKWIPDSDEPVRKRKVNYENAPVFFGGKNNINDYPKIQERLKEENKKNKKKRR